MKEDIKARLLARDIFEAPRRSGKTEAIIDIIAEQPGRFLILATEALYLPLMNRLTYRGIPAHPYAGPVFSNYTWVATEGKEILVDEYFLHDPNKLAKVRGIIFAGVGTPLDRQDWIYVPSASTPMFSDEEEEFDIHMSPRV